MTLDTQIAALTQSTNDMLTAVNTRKATFDSSISAASVQAGNAAGSAAQALAIYGSTAAVNTAVANAQSAASLAAGYAASAGSAIQQDISGVTAAALHRSPAPVTAMFVYDTTKDSDGGAWTEKCQHTSWYNEPLNGKWLGAAASEIAARYTAGTLGSELVTNGTFDSNITGWSAGTGNSLLTNPSGQLRVENGNATSCYASQSLAAVAGKVYQVSLTIAAKSGTPARFTFGGYDTSYTLTAGTTTFIMQATSTAGIVLQNGASGLLGEYTAWDSVSIKEVTAVSAVTGDYFQLTTDGKFYKLNATSGTTQVARGNKAKFPKIAAIVAESYSVIIYDLTEPGRPMWLSCTGSANGLYTNQLSTLFALNGMLCIGSNSAALNRWTFPLDKIDCLLSSGRYVIKAPISGRNSLWGYTEFYSSPALASSVVNAVSMTVLPDAPVDPVSGLQLPTIAVATNGGVSVIKHDGTVGNWLTTSGLMAFIAFDKSNYLVASGGGGVAYGTWMRTTMPTGTDNTSTLTSGTAPPRLGSAGGVNSTAQTVSKSTKIVATTGLGVFLLKDNQAASARTPVAYITSVYNTGWQAGDIRRAYLADGIVETLSASTELVVDGGFDDPTKWTLFTGSAFTVGSGVMTVAAAGGVDSIMDQTTGSYLVAGKLYRMSWNVVSSTANYGPNLCMTNPSGSGTYGISGYIGNSGATGPGSVAFVAPITGKVRMLRIGAHTGTVVFDNLSIQEVVPERSYKGAVAFKFGSLSKSLSSPSASNQLAACSGFSASNYLQEPYSADLDFGTGEWNVSAWVNIPVTLPVASFPVIGSELVGDPSFDNPAYWTLVSGWSISGGVATASSVSAGVTKSGLLTIGKCYQATITATITSGSAFLPYDSAAANEQFISASGTYTRTFFANSTTLYAAYPRTTLSATFDNISVKEVGISVIAERSYSSGPYIKLGVDVAGHLVASANDGTTTITITTSAAYNTGLMLKARAVYRLDGSLAIMVNGVEVAVKRGNPLLTLNNSNAVLTIGNNYALTAPFPGSIALLKLSATAPTPDQSLWMYEQEKHLFRDGANCLLPDSGNIVDLTYDDLTDKWIAISATNESTWTGLVRTGVTPVPAGSNIKTVANSGIKLNARSTTSPGVDVTIPARNLWEELVKRQEVKQKDQPTTVFDFTAGFTATTVIGNSAITAVAGLAYPSQCSIIGATVTGVGIPASTVIVGVSGTTIYLSKVATAAGTTVQISFVDFILPVGYEARVVSTAGATKQEGATKDWVRSTDGFREKVTFNTAPGYSTFVEIEALRSIV